MEQLSPGEALSRLKQLISSGMSGRNYTFVPTEKNRLLLDTYYIDDKKKIDILNSLDEKDYIKDEYSHSEDFQDNYMYVFLKKDVPLLLRFSEDIAYKKVDIYIKFYFGNEKRSLVVILSLHEAGDY